jgi:protein tyrosine/serine phosphatase
MDNSVGKRGTVREACCIAARALACVLVLSVSGCVYFSSHTVKGACSNDLDSPIRNFCVVAPQVLWRGEKPNGKDAAWLVDHHVGTVVNLEVFFNDHRAFDEAAADPDSSRRVDYFHLPDFEPVHIINWSLLDDHVAEFLAIVSEAPKPVYVHCLDGIDRTNALVAAYRVLIEGDSREKAIEEMARFHSPYHRFDARYISGLEGDRRVQIMHKVSKWRSRLKPSAQIACSGGKCLYSARP